MACEFEICLHREIEKSIAGRRLKIKINLHREDKKKKGYRGNTLGFNNNLNREDEKR